MDGELEIVTSDNLAEGVDFYPDRSDVAVWGLAGSLTVELESGNVTVQVDPGITHYAGCPLADVCELGDPQAMPPLAPFDPACGCTQPTAIRVDNAPGQASNVVIDLPVISSLTGAPHWYDVRLAQSDASDECSASIDCDAFDCIAAEDPSSGEVSADIGYPGAPALAGIGIQVDAASSACAELGYVDDPTTDYGWNAAPHERRGNLRVCAGCLE